MKKLRKESQAKLDRLIKTRAQNKFNAKSQYYNGHFYHSTGEAEYAMKLDLLKKAGEILDWERQVKIELKVNGFHIANYYIDFKVINKDGTIELIEYKGVETAEWKMKYKLLLATRDEMFSEGVTVRVVKHKAKYKFK